MEIILNERKKAEEYLNTKIVDNVIQCTSILIRYYYSPITTDAEIYAIIDDFLKQSFIGYKSENWKSFIEYQIKNLKNRKLVEIDYIIITKREIETIKTLENNRLERLAFTLLAVAKYYNYINPNNNNWTNKDFKTIFSLANVPVTKEKQCTMINGLKNKGFITMSKKIDNLNLNVQFINNDSPIVFKIDDMRNLGNQYRMLSGDKKYKKCKKCGKVVKFKTNQKYCRNCAIDVKHKNQSRWIKEKRNSNRHIK